MLACTSRDQSQGGTGVSLDTRGEGPIFRGWVLPSRGLGAAKADLVGRS